MLSSRLADLSAFGGARECRYREAEASRNRLPEMVEAEGVKAGQSQC